MWLSGQQKRPAEQGEGHVGVITMSGGETAALLDCERRGLQVYAPAGYCWAPEVGQRVLIIQGKGEIPCVVGARQGDGTPKQAGIQAERVTIRGSSVGISGQNGVSIGGGVHLSGGVSIDGESLEQYIARVVGELLGGTTG